MESRGIRLAVLVDEKKHRIYLNGQDFEAGRIPKSSVIHELCHASLAENIDVSFGSCLLSRKYAHASHEFGTKALERDNTSFIDTSDQKEAEGTPLYDFFDVYHGSVELWVEELLLKTDRGMGAQRIEGYFRRFETVEKFERSKKTRRQTILSCSLVMALARRWEISPPMPIDLRLFFAPEEVAILEELIGHKERLPRLTYERSLDLRVLESEMQYIASLFGMEIVPRFQEEEGTTVWIFD